MALCSRQTLLPIKPLVSIFILIELVFVPTNFLFFCMIPLLNQDFYFYPKVPSEVIGRKSNYSKSGSNKRLTDLYLHSLVDTQPLVFTGNPGLCLLIDTDSCFHCGSRYAPQPRLMSLTRFTNILDFKIDNCFQIPFTS